jgi:hypothetical protein
MRYFRRPWDEPRGDAYDHRGPSTYFLEVGPDLWVTRQLEVYANGVAVAYDERVVHDEYGGLADQRSTSTRAAISPSRWTRKRFAQRGIARDR